MAKRRDQVSNLVKRRLAEVGSQPPEETGGSRPLDSKQAELIRQVALNNVGKLSQAFSSLRGNGLVPAKYQSKQNPLVPSIQNAVGDTAADGMTSLWIDSFMVCLMRPQDFPEFKEHGDTTRIVKTTEGTLGVIYC